MKSKEVLKILGVSRVTLTSYVKKNLIKATLMPNGYYNYDDKSVYEFSHNHSRINVIYARVSTYKQKNDLTTQINNIKKYCTDNNFLISSVFSEISSGIDLDRDQFNLLLNDVFKFKIDKIFISNKDRLTRLSFITLQNIFLQFGTSIIITSKKTSKSNNDELFDELISLMYYFSTKEYSSRKKLSKNNIV